MAYTFLQYRTRGAFEEDVAQELVRTGRSALQELTSADRDALLAHVSTLPRAKPRKNLTSMLLEAGSLSGGCGICILAIIFHIARAHKRSRSRMSSLLKSV